eukprot:g15334.t1
MNNHTSAKTNREIREQVHAMRAWGNKHTPIAGAITAVIACVITLATIVALAGTTFAPRLFASGSYTGASLKETSVVGEEILQRGSQVVCCNWVRQQRQRTTTPPADK